MKRENGNHQQRDQFVKQKEEGAGNLVLFEVLLLLFIAKLDQRYVYGISIFLIGFRINTTDTPKKKEILNLVCLRAGDQIQA